MILPTTTPSSLRILADQIERDENVAFAITIINADESISQMYGSGDIPYVLVGAIETMKIDIIKDCFEQTEFND